MASNVMTGAVLSVFFLCFLIPLCQAGGSIEIKVLRFQISCEDNTWNPFWSTECDTYFNFCIDNPGQLNFGSCDYEHFGPSSHFENTNHKHFGNSIGGISNPMVVDTDVFNIHRVMFGVQMYDKEAVQADEHLVTMEKTVSFKPARNKGSAPWSSAYMHSNGHHVWFEYRAYCDAHYYTSRCDVYCKARDDDMGHYTCNQTTGAKKCMRGWTGTNCDVDINECEQGPCFNGAPCTNTEGSYHCQCPSGLTGQNCDLIDSLCHSQPCQHNGTCTGNMTSYECTCPVAWTGTNCQEQVDFCQSSPCQNNATCYATVGNFSCVCDAGWTGTVCTTVVDGCDSSPCQNGATCTNMPRAEYECTCSPGYEGDRCQSEINPCNPSPCGHAGNCSFTNYDAYTCTCVEGWTGVNCSIYTTVESEQFEGKKTDKDLEWLPIVLSVLATVLIVVCILILLYIRRRKKQKELAARIVDEEHRGDQVVTVAGRDNLAFRNALYDNQANADIDRRAQMPVPSTPTAATASADDPFYPTKGKQLPDEEGAVGGANPYHDIDGDMGPTKCDITTRQKQAVALDTRTMAGAKDQGQSGANDYADFRELQRRSMMARQASVAESTATNPGSPDITTTSPDFMDQPVENHYHDIDDLCLEMSNDSTVQFINPAAAAAQSQYDLPPRHRPDESPGDAQGPGEGYMCMEGSTSRPTSQPTEPEHLESTDEEDDDVISQEDIDQLRREVLQRSTSTTEA